MTQEQRVLNYIREHGSITALQAFSDLKITQLGTRIFNLRAQGHDIETVDESYRSNGKTIRWAKYILHEVDNGREKNVCEDDSAQ